MRAWRENREHKAPFTIQQYALDAVALLDHLHIDKVTFAGHSMGGGVGFELAVNHAERLSRIVLMAPVGAGDKERIAERLSSQPEGVTAETWVTNAPQPTAADYEAEMKASRNGVRFCMQIMHADNLDADASYTSSCAYMGKMRVSNGIFFCHIGLASIGYRGVVRAPICVSGQYGQRAPPSVWLLDGHTRPAATYPGVDKNTALLLLRICLQLVNKMQPWNHLQSVGGGVRTGHPDAGADVVGGSGWAPSGQHPVSTISAALLPLGMLLQCECFVAVVAVTSS